MSPEADTGNGGPKPGLAWPDHDTGPVPPPEYKSRPRDDEVVRPGGFHGTQVLFNLKGEHGMAYTVNQTTLTDPADSHASWRT